MINNELNEVRAKIRIRIATGKGFELVAPHFWPPESRLGGLAAEFRVREVP